MMAVLVKAFITPIEREDIILLSQSIDEVTDKIEDVLIRTLHKQCSANPSRGPCLHKGHHPLLRGA